MFCIHTVATVGIKTPCTMYASTYVGISTVLSHSYSRYEHCTVYIARNKQCTLYIASVPHHDVGRRK
jgi:hypothetical protein